MAVSKNSGRVISFFSLAMLNVIAVDSLRSLPFAATFGFSLVFYYIIGALFFFIPCALVAAELATGWPLRGGIYVWVREAFGTRMGLFVIMMQWVYNICWYPTIMSFLAGTLAYMIKPSLIHSPAYMISSVFILYIGATFVNLFGMKVSSRFCNVAAIFGSIIPMFLIAALGFYWVDNGQVNQIHFTWGSFMPQITSIGSLVLFTNILFSLVGTEMSAIHAQNVKNPQKSYPRALIISTVVVLTSLVGGGLAIAVVLPTKNINLIAGMMEVFRIFFQTYHIPWMLNIIGFCVILGGLGTVSAWVLGPSRALLVAAEDGAIPPFMKKINKHNAPIGVLTIQGIIFSIFCLAFLLMPSINSTYWILSDMTAILSMFVYAMMFFAALRLRYKYPDIKRAYKIPFGNVGIWIVASVGSFTAIATIFIGLYPPVSVHVGSLFKYESLLIGGIIVFCSLPFILYAFRKPHWAAVKDTKGFESATTL